jgi:hypothetical protein
LEDLKEAKPKKEKSNVNIHDVTAPAASAVLAFMFDPVPL